MCYSNSVSFIELLRSFCIHDEAFAKILCSEKELNSKINSKLLWQFCQTGSHIIILTGRAAGGLAEDTSCFDSCVRI